MLERIEVFKAGKHRDVNGTDYEFSEADVASIAAAYDPALQAAPLVLGHPKTNDPAWGWAKSLAVEDGKIVAHPEKVDPAFAEGVEAGRYRYVSASFYKPTDPRNPKPGSWYLRHIGFLGAQPPAVKGLEAAFAEEPEEDLVNFSAADAWSVENLFRGLRDWIIEKDGLEVADRVIPGWWIESIKPEERNGPGFAEAGAENQPGEKPAVVDPALDARAADLDRRQAELDKRDAEFAESARAARRTEDEALLDGLVDQGRLPPAERAGVAALLAHLDGDATVSFAETDADPREELRGLLGKLGVSITFDEVSRPEPVGFGEAQTGDDYAQVIRNVMAEAEAQGRTLTASQAAAIARNR